MWVFQVFLVATILSPNPTPSLGQLGAYYFETLNQSQIWINLEPQGSIPGPNPIRLNVTVAFTGRRLDHSPDVVENVDTHQRCSAKRVSIICAPQSRRPIAG